MPDALSTLAHLAGARLQARHMMIACAESCTGGMVGSAITEVAGSSAWFERGFVTYSNEAKIEMLGVDAALIERYGAVSEEVARAMADGALRASRAQIAVSITGIAGPSGGTADKPVGMVCLAWAVQDAATQSVTEHFGGDRAAVREAASQCALRGVIERLDRP
jgi:nicotinamide-nucleotide amidase